MIGVLDDLEAGHQAARHLVGARLARDQRLAVETASDRLASSTIVRPVLAHQHEALPGGLG